MIENLKNLERDVLLGPLTTYKIGGPADYFVAVHSSDELAEAVKAARADNIPWFLLGTGANILIGDGGWRGLVIHNQSNHAVIDGNLLTVESGAVMADLIDLTIEHSLSGLEHYQGIPSSVGGAIWQNLHFLAPDRKNTMFIESVVQSARVLLADNQVIEVDRDWFNFGYDDSRLHHEEIVVLDVTFKLEPGDQDAIREQAAKNQQWRNERHPNLVEFPSCGSVFKKIEGIGAGRLIDGSGLKGYRIGGVHVSPKHANFLVNPDNGTAKDVMDLVHHVQRTVKEDSGYDLEMEIRTVGEFV